MRSLSLITLTFAAALVMQNAAQAADCHQIMGNPESKEGVAYCDDGSVQIGGKIKDVSMHTPLGGKNGFFQKAGRDTENTVHAIGHGAEHGAHEVGKFFARAFGW